MNTMQFQAFRRLVHEFTGVTISDSKREMLFARVSKRMHALEIDCFSSYYKRLTNDEHEKVAFVDTVTTHETRFFRTPRIWDYIEHELLTSWRPGLTARPFKAWSAAASSGEEAYSLSILLHECSEKNPGFTYEVHGSDVSQPMISRCGEGMYSQRSVAQFQESMPDRFQRSMKVAGDSYTPRAAFRKSVSFSQSNLFSPAKARQEYDLILLRNVLIYFSREDQIRALEVMHDRMRHGAILIIGESEFLSGLEHLFENVQPLVYRASHDVH
ncbi:MAG: protein-glutamate O-methyltransferase CheR [Pseudomonadales bacterium]